MLIVQKFGGSSVADAVKLARVAGIIADARQAGHQVVAVLSAQGDTTDCLLEKAHEINGSPSGRELDMLLTVGEQISVALLAMQLEAMHLPAVSLTGWQAGLRTDAAFGDARITEITADRVRQELGAGRIVLVTGFQGISPGNDLTTLGRGGSDTSAVALAAALHAERCLIYTDVDGVYTADPRKVPGARKLDAVSYAEILALTQRGSQVLHSRSVELAMRTRVEPEVRSAFTNLPGTVIGAAVPPRTLCGLALAPGGAVSLVGSGLTAETANAMDAVLADCGIAVIASSSGPLYRTVQVRPASADVAVLALHRAFFEG